MKHEHAHAFEADISEAELLPAKQTHQNNRVQGHSRGDNKGLLRPDGVMDRSFPIEQVGQGQEENVEAVAPMMLPTARVNAPCRTAFLSWRRSFDRAPPRPKIVLSLLAFEPKVRKGLRRCEGMA